MVNMMKSVHPSDTSVAMTLQVESHEFGRGSKDASAKQGAPNAFTDDQSTRRRLATQTTVSGASAVAKGAGGELTSNEGEINSSQSYSGNASSVEARGLRLESGDVPSIDADAHRAPQPPLPQGCDVLFGAVTKQRWPGNSLFNKLVQQRRKWTEKETAAADIARIVRRRGGTFYYCVRVQGKLTCTPCTDEQTIKYTMRHLESVTKSKLFSASTASYLQVLYSTHESSSASQVEPPPLEVKPHMVGVLLSDADPMVRTATAGAAERNFGTNARPPTGGGPGVGMPPSKSHPETKPHSGKYPYPHPYYHPHYPPPSYSYYPYQYYPQYHPSSGYSAGASAKHLKEEAGPDGSTGLPEPDPGSAESVDSSHAPSTAAEPNQKGQMQRTQQRLPTATRVANASNSTPRDTTEEAVLPSPSKPQLSSPPSLSSSPASSVSSSKGNKGLPKATGAEKGMCVDAKSTQFSSKVSIPKGVTVRPSGKWQAQFYFFGKSRYVGVYDTALQASVAYSAALYLAGKYKQGIRNASLNNDVDPRVEADRLLAAARILGRNAALKFQEELDKNTRLNNSTVRFNNSTENTPFLTESAYACAKQYFETQASSVYRPPMDCDAAE